VAVVYGFGEPIDTQTKPQYHSASSAHLAHNEMGAPTR
jgi:hypothetical protein